MQYTVALRFTTLKVIDRTHLREFLYVMPYMLQHIVRQDFPHIVNEVELQSDTDIVVALEADVPAPTGLEEEAARLSVDEPDEARTTAALMLWIGSIRRLGDSPLKRAWYAFCQQRALPYGPLPPVALVGYALKRRPKVDQLPHLTIIEYDGSTATPA